MKSYKILAFIELYIDLISKDLEYFARYLIAKRKSERKMFKRMALASQEMLQDSAQRALNEK